MTQPVLLKAYLGFDEAKRQDAVDMDSESYYPDFKQT